MTTLPPPTRPRLGFLGLGSLGRRRLAALCQAGIADVVALADESDEACARALAIAPGATRAPSLDALLDRPIDGVVIATPRATRARQAMAALRRDVAVFSQTPVARTAAGTRLVLDEARRADRLLGVDLPHRHMRAVAAAAAVLHSGRLGAVYAADFAFHQARGPDQAWADDRDRSGGGCLIGLGTALIDLACWLHPGGVRQVSSRLFAAGRRLTPPLRLAEDFAQLVIETASGAALTITCSWRLHAGRDTVIECRWYGTSGGLRVANVGGSASDFVAERFDGARATCLVDPPDDWGGRAIVAWTRALARGAGYDPAMGGLEEVAAVIDAAYHTASGAAPRPHPPEQLGATSRAL
jgi:predicted dehydrogenase